MQIINIEDYLYPDLFLETICNVMFANILNSINKITEQQTRIDRHSVTWRMRITSLGIGVSTAQSSFFLFSCCSKVLLLLSSSEFGRKNAVLVRYCFCTHTCACTVQQNAVSILFLYLAHMHLFWHVGQFYNVVAIILIVATVIYLQICSD